MKPPAPVAGLYAIVDTGFLTPPQLLPAAQAAIAGGARGLQYRAKPRPDRPPPTTTHVGELRALCRRHRVVFIVNDDIELARSVDADGVHLGRDDAAVPQARRRLGDTAIIGVSCYNELTRARQAQGEGADYVAFGSFYPSATKPAAVCAPLSLLVEAKAALALPLVAIGGITPENGAALVAAGADALAVIQGLFVDVDTTSQARRYAALFA